MGKRTNPQFSGKEQGVQTQTDFAENTGFQQRYKGNSVEKEVFELNGATTFAHAHAKKELSPSSQTLKS